MVLCIIRFLENPKYMITATISTGAPNKVRKTIATIGTARRSPTSLISASSVSSASRWVAVTFRCFFNFLLIRCWILAAKLSEADALTVVLGQGGIAGDGAFAAVGAVDVA